MKRLLVLLSLFVLVSACRKNDTKLDFGLMCQGKWQISDCGWNADSYSVPVTYLSMEFVGDSVFISTNPLFRGSGYSYSCSAHEACDSLSFYTQGQLVTTWPVLATGGNEFYILLPDYQCPFRT